jgi:hypothetical protein
VSRPDGSANAWSQAHNAYAGGAATTVDGLFAVASALDGVAKAIQRLGNADAATPMGGLEALGAAVKAAGEEIASAISSQDST